MKIVKRDAELREKEKEEKEIKSKKDQAREDYLEQLKKNKKFQEVVVNGIIRKHIDSLTDMRQLQNANFENLEEVGKLVLQSKMSRLVLEKILAELI